MDRHDVPGISLGDAAQAHLEDISFQKQYDCECLTYWVDEERGNAFCLIKAPSLEAVKELHNHSHGLIPHAIIEVDSNVVDAFLGRIQDPVPFTYQKGTELSIFNDPAFRTILVIKQKDEKILRPELKSKNLQSQPNDYLSHTIKLINQFKGRIVEDNDGLIASFASVTNAVECSLHINRGFKNDNKTSNLNRRISIGISAGIPVTDHKHIFGDTLQQAKNLCFIAEENKIYTSSIIKELYRGKLQQEFNCSDDVVVFTHENEEFLISLMETISRHYHDEKFNLDSWSFLLGVSKSKLYRKSKSITGKSPNEFLKEFRLIKAIELMTDKSKNVSQAAFEAGFQSPSYFTKCFKKRFGLLPTSLLKNSPN